ncbi:hypothetical protein QBC38DRAFT_477152 [Podospora fimiseda]|uniref:Uncharacterized protein n=1 Tax=Podospora fimiseda TaxID=252190 RepID=A0AAN7GZD0_9PEZI|nr:hypothetical protein QBC38DRAFT_477152 [Podospora fimiseda]
MFIVFILVIIIVSETRLAGYLASPRGGWKPPKKGVTIPWVAGFFGFAVHTFTYLITYCRLQCIFPSLQGNYIHIFIPFLLLFTLW